VTTILAASHLYASTNSLYIKLKTKTNITKIDNCTKNYLYYSKKRRI